jgi:hypothetical protein
LPTSQEEARQLKVAGGRLVAQAEQPKGRCSPQQVQTAIGMAADLSKL